VRERRIERELTLRECLQEKGGDSILDKHIVISPNLVSSAAMPEDCEGIFDISQEDSGDGGGDKGWEATAMCGEIHEEEKDFIIPEKRVTIRCGSEERTVDG
jgi:hypothetical protein